MRECWESPPLHCPEACEAVVPQFAPRYAFASITLIRFQRTGERTDPLMRTPTSRAFSR